jgi:hypothetical protein
VRGLNGDATADVVGGRATGPWIFTTFEIDFEKQNEKLDLIKDAYNVAVFASNG